MAMSPLTGQSAPAALIGAIVCGSGNPANGMVTPDKTGSFGLTRGLIRDRGVQFGPRFGLAWTPEGQGGKTVVRLGGGVFYERIQGNMIFNQINFLDSALPGSPRTRIRPAPSRPARCWATMLCR
jgi:hypothetical protein